MRKVRNLSAYQDSQISVNRKVVLEDACTVIVTLYIGTTEVKMMVL